MWGWSLSHWRRRSYEYSWSHEQEIEISSQDLWTIYLAFPHLFGVGDVSPLVSHLSNHIAPSLLTSGRKRISSRFGRSTIIIWIRKQETGNWEISNYKATRRKPVLLSPVSVGSWIKFPESRKKQEICAGYCCHDELLGESGARRIFYFPTLAFNLF